MYCKQRTESILDFSDCKQYALQPLVTDEIIKNKRCTNELLMMEKIIVTVV
jgi:hypothetical protein